MIGLTFCNYCNELTKEFLTTRGLWCSKCKNMKIGVTMETQNNSVNDDNERQKSDKNTTHQQINLEILDENEFGFDKFEQQINDWFSHHKMSEEQIINCNFLESETSSFAFKIMNIVPDCADRTVAFRKLHEFLLIAKSAIAINK